MLTPPGVLVSERYPNLCWAQKWHGRHLGRTEIRIERQDATPPESPQKSGKFRCSLLCRRIPGWTPPRFVSPFVLDGHLMSFA